MANPNLPLEPRDQRPPFKDPRDASVAFYLAVAAAAVIGLGGIIWAASDEQESQRSAQNQYEEPLTPSAPTPAPAPATPQ